MNVCENARPTNLTVVIPIQPKSSSSENNHKHLINWIQFIYVYVTLYSTLYAYVYIFFLHCCTVFSHSISIVSCRRHTTNTHTHAASSAFLCGAFVTPNGPHPELARVAPRRTTMRTHSLKKKKKGNYIMGMPHVWNTCYKSVVCSERFTVPNTAQNARALSQKSCW